MNNISKVTSSKGKSPAAPEKIKQCCNYSNNYYGDQVCVKKN